MSIDEESMIKLLYRRLGMLALLALCGAVLVSSHPALAQTPVPPPLCTDFANLGADIDSGEPGVLSNIVNFIKPVMWSASQALFESFTGSDAYQYAVMAAATLMVVIYGVAFIIGVVQATFGEVLKRLIRLGIIFWVISPDGWLFFTQYVVTFFDEGTDYIIGEVLQIGLGVSYTYGVDQSPFAPIDGMASYMLSPDIIIAILGSATSGGPYGSMMAALMGFAFVGFIKLLIDGLKVYAISFIVRMLLYGVAPIFIIFLLFDKTRPMFTGWLNTIVSHSLQPILYFTFLSFFLTMMMGAAKDMLGGNELCWTEFESIEGTPNKGSGWRFASQDDKNAAGAGRMGWEGPVNCVISGEDCQEFPINILDLLTFLILVYVATRFSGVVDNIAAEISNSFANLSTQGKMDMRSMLSGGDKAQQPGRP
jgi:type IV secretory pathway VirB6-like protein